jgi:hypothetical protein
VPVLKQTIVFRGFSIISGIGIADLQTLEGSDIESAATNSNGPDKEVNDVSGKVMWQDATVDILAR